MCASVCYLCDCHNRNISFLSTCRCAEEKHIPPELLGRSCFSSLKNSATGCFCPPDPSSLPEITCQRPTRRFNLRLHACCPCLRSVPLQTFAARRWDPAANDLVSLFQTKGQLWREKRCGAGKCCFNACEWCSLSVGGGIPRWEEPAQSAHPNTMRCVSPSV